MNWDAIGASSELVGAIAVVVTLVYLALQVHQNTRVLRSQGLQSAIEKYLCNIDNVTKSPAEAEIFRRGLNDFESLPPGEQGSFHSQMHSLLHGFNNVWNLHKAGLLPDFELVAMRGLFVSHLICPGAQSWWNSFKDVPPPHLVEYLDDAIGEADGQIEPATERFPWLRSN